jgi:hypothetical protein
MLNGEAQPEGAARVIYQQPVGSGDGGQNGQNPPQHQSRKIAATRRNLMTDHRSSIASSS